MYFVKTPWWLKKIYSHYHWEMPTPEKKLYLTFDDGPHPEATPYVLETLHKYEAKGTFFCIGKNVQEEPEIFHQTQTEGHRIGNHTHNHLNGWKTDTDIYLDNVFQASSLFESDLFRPPYGRITKKQARLLLQPQAGQRFNIIMWDVLSADFDQTITPDKCLQNVLKNAMEGSIVVFHDSRKAFKNLQYTLPKVLEHFSEKGFVFDSIRKEGMKKGPE